MWWSIATGPAARRSAWATSPVISLPNSPTLGERDPGLTAEGWFRSEHMTYPYGVQIGVVRVDAETGEATVERYLLAYDIGRSINPMLVKGQLVGGFVQGLGGALYEEFRYDERGEPLSVTLADYLLPTARETPAVEVLVTEDAPSPLNPLGIKSVGEDDYYRRRCGHRRGDRRGDWQARRGDPASRDTAAHQSAAAHGGAAWPPGSSRGTRVNRMSSFVPLIQDLVIANWILAREIVDAYGHVSVRIPTTPTIS